MKRIALVAVVLWIAGCGLPLDSKIGSSEVEVSLDAVKLIGPEFEDGNDPATFDQDQYEVMATHRLLLRFEGFGEKGKKVDVSGTNKMIVTLTTISDTNADQLELCPVSTNWMMLATWNYAHPFNAQGKWKVGGGDFQAIDCVSGTLVPVNSGSKAAGFSYAFDVTNWAKNYLKVHGKNFGFLLKGPASVWVVGERSANYSPRVKFSELP